MTERKNENGCNKKVVCFKGGLFASYSNVIADKRCIFRADAKNGEGIEHNGAVEGRLDRGRGAAHTEEAVRAGIFIGQCRRNLRHKNEKSRHFVPEKLRNNGGRDMRSDHAPLFGTVGVVLVRLGRAVLLGCVAAGEADSGGGARRELHRTGRRGRGGTQQSGSPVFSGLDSGRDISVGRFFVRERLELERCTERNESEGGARRDKRLGSVRRRDILLQSEDGDESVDPFATRYNDDWESCFLLIR